MFPFSRLCLAFVVVSALILPSAVQANHRPNHQEHILGEISTIKNIFCYEKSHVAFILKKLQEEGVESRSVAQVGELGLCLFTMGKVKVLEAFHETYEQVPLKKPGRNVEHFDVQIIKIEVIGPNGEESGMIFYTWTHWPIRTRRAGMSL